jgi:transposase-like protein
VRRGAYRQQLRLPAISKDRVSAHHALRKAICNTFGQRVLVQRCQEHKRRNVLAQLPKKLHPSVNKTLRDAYRSPSKAVAKRRLLQLTSKRPKVLP